MEMRQLQKRLAKKRPHMWQRWKAEIHTRPCGMTSNRQRNKCTHLYRQGCTSTTTTTAERVKNGKGNQDDHRKGRTNRGSQASSQETPP